MIKIFERERKMNAVDDNNRLVGYDTADDCCAHGGYFISDKIERDEVENPAQYDLTAYSFDDEFFKRIKNTDDYNEFEAVIFKMIAPEKPDLYLHCFNVHNGYYSKGFEASFGPERSGSV